MTYKKLRSNFPDHRLVRFISTKQGCPLSLKERWVYSTLLWRYKCRPVSKSRLSKWTGVDRTRTLPRILTRLSNLRLVVRDGKKFKSVAPPDDLMPWFASYISGFGENERLVPSYNWAVYIRDRDIIDNLVACADSLGHHAAAKLAKRFGVCAKTITAARRRIRKPVHDSPPELSSKLKSVVDSPLITSDTNVAVTSSPLDGYEFTKDCPLLASKGPISFLTRNIAYELSRYHGLGVGTAKELEKLCDLLKGLSRKEIGQIVSALVNKFGVGEGLEDAIWHLLQRKYYEYLPGTTYEKVMKDIGVKPKAYSNYDLDDLGMFQEEEFEMEV